MGNPEGCAVGTPVGLDVGDATGGSVAGRCGKAAEAAAAKWQPGHFPPGVKWLE